MRDYQRNYGGKKSVLADVLNLILPSMNMSAVERIHHLDNPEPMHDHLDDHEYEQPIVERPQPSSTPAKKGKNEQIV